MERERGEKNVSESKTQKHTSICALRKLTQNTNISHHAPQNAKRKKKPTHPQRRYKIIHPLWWGPAHSHAYLPRLRGPHQKIQIIQRPKHSGHNREQARELEEEGREALLEGGGRDEREGGRDDACCWEGAGLFFFGI